jgi:hypothetical protein
MILKSYCVLAILLAGMLSPWPWLGLLLWTLSKGVRR